MSQDRRREHASGLLRPGRTQNQQVAARMSHVEVAVACRANHQPVKLGVLAHRPYQTRPGVPLAEHVTDVALRALRRSGPAPAVAAAVARLPIGQELLTPALGPVEVTALSRRCHLPSLVRGAYDAALTGPGRRSVRSIGNVFFGWPPHTEIRKKPGRRSEPIATLIS